MSWNVHVLLIELFCFLSWLIYKINFHGHNWWERFLRLAKFHLQLAIRCDLVNLVIFIDMHSLSRMKSFSYHALRNVFNTNVTIAGHQIHERPARRALPEWKKINSMPITIHKLSTGATCCVYKCTNTRARARAGVRSANVALAHHYSSCCASNQLAGDSPVFCTLVSSFLLYR